MSTVNCPALSASTFNLNHGYGVQPGHCLYTVKEQRGSAPEWAQSVLISTIVSTATSTGKVCHRDSYNGPYHAISTTLPLKIPRCFWSAVKRLMEHLRHVSEWLQNIPVLTSGLRSGLSRDTQNAQLPRRAGYTIHQVMFDRR